MKAIINAKIVMYDHIIPNGVILIDEGVIFAYGKAAEITVPSDAEIIDAEGNFVGPGLIDVHTHAADNTWFYAEPKRASEHCLAHGVTSVLPALYMSLNKKEYLDAVDSIITANKNGEFENFYGFYMEGPYLNPNFGCDREHNVWKDAIVKEQYQEIVEKVKDTAKIWCLAPEREGAEEFVKEVKKAIPNVIFSVAHSEAVPWQVERFIPYGLKLATHHTNATGTVFKYSECRGVCVDEIVNYNKEIYAEIISDRMGIHVDPYMQRLIRRVKGDDRIILISDQFVCDGPVPKGYEEATDLHFDWAGEIAGSGLTLDIACQNFMIHTGCSVCDCFRFASYNPARLLGDFSIGRIDVGTKADLIIVDGDFNVKKTFKSGKQV